MEYTDGNCKYKIEKIGGVLNAWPKSVETIPVKLATDNIHIIQVLVQKAGVFVNVNVEVVVTQYSTFARTKVAEGMPIPLFDFGDGKADGIAFGSVDSTVAQDVTFSIDNGVLYVISRGIDINGKKCFCNFNYIAKS